MTEYKLVPIEPTWDMTLAGVVWYANHGHDNMSQSDCAELFKAMLSAAPPIQPIDVEKLKRNSCHYFRKTGQYCNDGCFVCEQDIGYNEAIDHLAASGYLHAPQPRIDVEKLKLDVFNAYERCRGILPEVLENIDKDRLNSHLAYRMISFAIDHLASHYNITKKGEQK